MRQLPGWVLRCCLSLRCWTAFVAAFSYRDSPSPASRPASCRYASGLADVAMHFPCPIGVPELPWRYAPEVVSHLPRCATSLPDPTSESARFRVERCFSPYPVHYSRAFAFSAFLYPQRQQRSLRFACRYRQHYGLTLFRMNLRAGRTLPLRRRLIVHGGPVFKDHSSPRTVLVQACQHVWLVKAHDV